MNKKKVLIAGCGLAGLSTAWHLGKKGIKPYLFEKEPGIGGLCRSKNVSGFTFDYDGHLLHFRHNYAFDLVRNILGDNLVEHKRNAWVYSHHRYTRYPFQANLYGLPADVIKECLLGYIGAIKNNKNNASAANFLEWININFGPGIAKHFMVPYNNKFWTVSPEELTCEWLDDFIPLPSLNQVLEGTVEESRRQLGYNSRFWYPRVGGIDVLAKGFARNLDNVFAGDGIDSINLLKKEVRTTSGRKEKFDILVSTIPLPELPNLISGLPKKIKRVFEKLRWNSIFNLNLGVDRPDSLGRHWVYFPDKDICFFRVGFFNNFSPYLAPAGKSSLYVEVSYPADKSLNKNHIIGQIMRDLKKVGMLNEYDKVCVQDKNDLKYGYPLYDKHYSRARKEILKYLSRNNIVTCGRYGSWRYMSMEDVIMNGRDVAASI